jgi:hypothetical protein
MTPGVFKKAREGVIGSVLDNFEWSLPRMEPFLRALKISNTGLEYLIVVDENNVFRGVYILLPWAIEMLEKGYAQKVYALDGAHMKNVLLRSDVFERTYLRKDYLTLISGRTLDGSNIPCAFSITDAENSANMSTLNAFCQSFGFNIDQVGFILLSDRGSAILKFIAASYTLLYHMYCQKHLAANVTSKHFTVNALSLYWEAAR